MAIRVFVSHSTMPRPRCAPEEQAKIEEHARFRRYFCERLKGVDGIDVVVDDQIPAGDRWREFLFEILGGCNAAVILANEQAILRSPWVTTEAKILGCRAWNERRDFRLIVVPFDGVTSGTIAQHPEWEPMALTEFQMIPRGGLRHDDPREVEATVEAVIAALEPLGDRDRRSTTSGWIVARLGGLLDLDVPGLRDLAHRVEADIAGIHEVHALRRRVLRRLYEMGTLGLRELLLCPLVPDDHLDPILELLSTSWVDMEASSSLLAYGRPDGTGGPGGAIPVLNGRLHDFTPQTYIRQVCGATKPWPVIALHAKASQDDMLDQLRAELQARLLKGWKGATPGPLPISPDAVDARVNKLLGDRLKLEFPVFAALPPEAATDSGLRTRIRATYPALRLIVCSGTEPGRTAFPKGLRLLRPEIDLGREQDESDLYDAMKGIIHDDR